jgi:predicted dehydrogenase
MRNFPDTPSIEETCAPLRIGIIGAGRMGRIRAFSARAHPGCRLVSVFDSVPARAQALATELGCLVDEGWEGLLQRPDLDGVVIATPHKFLSPIAVAAVRAGKYVFCEKPMARTAQEAEEVRTAVGAPKTKTTARNASTVDQRVIVGYTLRHHPAVSRAKQLLTEGVIGEPFLVRGHYGHGGRAGYEKEWRGDRDLSGGGELLDQGVHLIDLSRWFLGEFRQVVGFLDTYFWVSTHRDALPASLPEGTSVPTGGVPPAGCATAVEDNAFMLLRTSRGKTAMLHVSWTQWKNQFSFEIVGPKGCLVIEGLGGSYGQERLIVGRRRIAGGTPEMEEVRFDPSNEPGTETPNRIPVRRSFWDEEWAAFVRGVQNDKTRRGDRTRIPSATLLDGCQNLRITDAVYRSAKQNAIIDLEQKDQPRICDSVGTLNEPPACSDRGM